MSVWRDFLKGLTKNNITAPEEASHGPAAGGRIERLCAELKWPVEKRDGNAIHLHLNDQGGGVRTVVIVDNEDEGDPFVTFDTRSLAVLPASNVYPGILAYLLRRNIDGSGAAMFGMHVDDEDRVTFHVMYHALVGGLDARALKYVCESLVNQAADFDGKMRQAKLLR